MFAASPTIHVQEDLESMDQLGSAVMQIAAQNLTPVTLELGGKSPVILHPDFLLVTEQNVPAPKKKP